MRAYCASTLLSVILLTDLSLCVLTDSTALALALHRSADDGLRKHNEQTRCAYISILAPGIKSIFINTKIV